MSSFALLLLIGSAFSHASWNLLAKRTGGVGPEFIWLFGVVSVGVYAPIAFVIALAWDFDINLGMLLMLLFGSGALHTVYFVLLMRGYKAGDLSLVYPLARGTGPLLATAGAILWLGERPSSVALAGTVLIVGGVFVISWTGHPPITARDRALVSVGYGIATGALVASYTLWDNQIVSAFLVPPFLLQWSLELVRTLLLTPLALGRLERTRSAWRNHRREVLGVALLHPISYLLFLSALAIAPVSYVAPARELSIVIGTILGTRLLHERHGGRRLVGAGITVCGVVVLALN